MTRPNEGLNRQQEWAQILEQEAARQLLAHGVQVLGATDHSDHVRDAVLTCWSIGAEKLLKTSLYLWTLQQGQTPEITRNHDVVHLAHEVEASINTWLSQRPRPDHVTELVASVAEDPVQPVLFAALAGYGMSGRFHHLDLLRGEDPTSDDPRLLWRAVLDAAGEEVATSEQLAVLVASSPTELDRFAGRVRARVNETLVRWWFMLTQLARNGWLGPGGQVFGLEAGPKQAVPRIDVARILASP